MTAAIEAENLHFAFPDGREALRGLSLTVRLGEAVGIIGPNGAGKTTFFLSLIGLCRLREGKLHVAGMQVANGSAMAGKKTLTEVRRKVGLVFQNSDDQLFSASVYDDVAFGPLNLGLKENEVRHRVDTALRRVLAEPYADRVSHHLSAGEKRRVALACVLAMEPDILVVDEPTNDLDPRSRRATINVINQVDQTRLIASHDLEFILETCDRTVLVEEGRVVADGPARALLANREVMESHGLEVPPSLAK